MMKVCYEYATSVQAGVYLVTVYAIRMQPFAPLIVTDLDCSLKKNSGMCFNLHLWQRAASADTSSRLL